MLLFHCLLPVIATDRAHRTPYTYAVLLLPARNPTNSSICIRIANRRVPLCDPHLHFARFARDIYAISPQKPIHARFCRRHCRSTPCFASFDSLYSRKRCRGAHFFAFSFHVEHTSCHSPKPQRLSGFLLVYAYLYIASLHVFSLMRSLLPSLRSFSHCRSVSDDRASTPLSYTRFRIPPSRTRAVSSIRVCILFPRSSLSSPIFSISFHLTLAIGVTFALFACTFL